MKRIGDILDNGFDIIKGSLRIGRDNLALRHAMSQQAQDMLRTETSVFDNGSATKNLRIDNTATHRENLLDSGFIRLQPLPPQAAFSMSSYS
jgi:hypothetical protein